MLDKIRKLFGRVAKEDDSELFTFESGSSQQAKQLQVTDENCYGIAAKIMKAVGGEANVEYADCCITRLRIKLYDRELVDEELLVEAGAIGIIPLGSRSMHVVLGTHAQRVVDTFNEILSLYQQTHEREVSNTHSVDDDEGLGCVPCVDEEELERFMALSADAQQAHLASMNEDERELYLDEIDDLYASLHAEDEEEDLSEGMTLGQLADHFKK